MWITASSSPKPKKGCFMMTDEETMEEYLGTLITYGENGSFWVSRPHLIDRMIESVHGTKDTRNTITSASAGITLKNDENGDLRKENWNYRSIIGMFNYLVNCKHLEMTYSVHQCARSCNDPKHSHEQAAKRSLRYLIWTTKNGGTNKESNQGII